MDGSVYEYQPSFILGFHGCDRSVGEGILSGEKTHLNASEKEWDWLGKGIYFWEGSVARAFEWAQDRKAQGKIKEPFVLGAVIDLRHCLDLFDREAMRLVAATHKGAVKSLKLAGKPVPSNSGKTPDLANRKLDCMVLNAVHEMRAGAGLQPFDSVRGPFLEGKPIYPKAGFRSHSHIQICVCNRDCIKGYFRPIAPTRGG